MSDADDMVRKVRFCDEARVVPVVAALVLRLAAGSRWATSSSDVNVEPLFAVIVDDELAGGGICKVEKRRAASANFRSVMARAASENCSANVA